MEQEKTRAEIKYHDDGSKRAEIQYKGDHVHGTTRTWHLNGQIESEIPVFSSKKHGVSKHWNASGKLLGTNLFVHGTGVFRSWHDNGQLQSETWLANEIPEGWQRCWCENGELLVETFFSKGKIVKQKKAIAAIEAKWSQSDKSQDALQFASAEALENCVRIEAREWLGDGSLDRRLGENFTYVDSLQLVDEVYECGAKRVEVALFGESIDDADSVSMLVVELPPDAHNREKVFSIKSDVERFSGLDEEDDVGQVFVFVAL